MSGNTKLLLALLGGLLLGAVFSDYARFGFSGWNDHWYGHHGRGYARTSETAYPEDPGHCWDSE